MSERGRQQATVLAPPPLSLTFRTRHHHRPRALAVQQDGQVHLARQGQLFGDQQRVDRLALGPRLLGDQGAPQHPFSQGGRVPGLHNVDTTLQAVGEVAQAAAACEDLRLDDDVGVRVAVRHGGRRVRHLVQGEDGDAGRDVDAAFGHDLGALCECGVGGRPGSMGAPCALLHRGLLLPPRVRPRARTHTHTTSHITDTTHTLTWYSWMLSQRRWSCATARAAARPRRASVRSSMGEGGYVWEAELKR